MHKYFGIFKYRIFNMKLIFVYNADATPISGFMESAHKLFKPETYACHLCALTHGVFVEKRQWRVFRKKSNIPFDFLHKNDFLNQYRSKWLPKYEFPLILMQIEGGIEIFMMASEIERFKTLSEFINEVEKKLMLF